MTARDLRKINENAALEPFYDTGEPVKGFSWYHKQIKKYTYNKRFNTFYIIYKRA